MPKEYQDQKPSGCSLKGGILCAGGLTIDKKSPSFAGNENIKAAYAREPQQGCSQG